MTSPFRAAIVGAGPAGIYAGNILRAQLPEASIDLFETLPAPYGLIRYGVAPDHPRIKGIVNSLHEMLDSAGIRLIGNVEIGTDLGLSELREHYDAVILATGASRDARLELPGVELPGSFGAADFVAWYDGHPDVPRDWPLEAREIAVLGNGNVALDIARVLAKHPADLLSTDIPANVYEGLAASPATDVHVFGRRGPGSIKFTPIELRELGEVPGVDIVLDDADFIADAHAETQAAGNNQLKVMARILNGWRERPVPEALEGPAPRRRLHLHFWHEPAEILGDGRVEGIRFHRTEPVGDGTVRRTGESREYPAQAVYRAVGYYGSPVDGVPFDEARGVIPNAGGRVLDENGEPIPGLYATGWIKRGPVGLIGHTKGDAMETIANLVEDREQLVAPRETDPEAILALLEARGVQYTSWEGWLALDAHERALGEAFEAAGFENLERERVKVVPREEQVEISRSGALVEG